MAFPAAPHGEEASEQSVYVTAPREETLRVSAAAGASWSVSNNARGEAAWLAAVDHVTAVMLAVGDDSPTAVASSGDVTADGDVIESPATVALTDDGRLVLESSVTPPAATGAAASDFATGGTGQAILACSTGDGACLSGAAAFDTLVRAGQTVSDHPALRLCELRDVLAASSYGIAFRAGAAPDCGDQAVPLREGVFRRGADGGIVTLALEGDPALFGDSDARYRGFFGPLSIEAGGAVVFSAELSDAGSTRRRSQQAVFSCLPQRCPAEPATRLLRRGRRLPGGRRLVRILSALVRNGGDVLVTARVAGSGRAGRRRSLTGRDKRGRRRTAIYLRFADGRLRRVTSEGARVAGGREARLVAIDLPSLSPKGRVAFRGRTRSPQGDRGQGIFLLELPPAQNTNAGTADVAAEGICGDFNLDGNIAATDALGSLKAAVGSASCLPCICDTDQSGSTTATDALRVLQRAVGLNVTLSCKADGTPLAWDGGGDGVSWHDSLNWTGDRLPDLCDAVTIEAGGTITVIHDNQGNGAAESVTTTESFDLTGGTLTVRHDMNVAKTLRVAGGTLKDATVPAGSGGAGGVLFTSSGGWLDGVTMASAMNLMATSSYVRILNGLVLEGTASLGNGATIEFRGGIENPLSGSGTVVFAAGTGILSVVQSGTVLRIASTITIRGGTGYVGGSSQGLIVQGVIDSDSTGQITVRGSGWDNQGTLRASGGDLRLEGSWTNNGTVDARAGVTILAPNGFTQGSSGAFTVEVAGDSNNGLLSVTGAASVAGTLNVDRTGGYVPANGSSFTVMTYGSSSGGFSNVTGSDAGGGNQFVPTLGATSLVLDVM